MPLIIATNECKLTKLRIKITFRHLRHVVLMKKLTLITLLAKPSKPVLTHHGLFTFSVSKRTDWPSVAHVPHKIFTHGCSRFYKTRHQEEKNTQPSILSLKSTNFLVQSFLETTLKRTKVSDGRYPSHRILVKFHVFYCFKFSPNTISEPQFLLQD